MSPIGARPCHSDVLSTLLYNNLVLFECCCCVQTYLSFGKTDCHDCRINIVDLPSLHSYRCQFSQESDQATKGPRTAVVKSHNDQHLRPTFAKSRCRHQATTQGTSKITTRGSKKPLPSRRGFSSRHCGRPRISALQRLRIFRLTSSFPSYLGSPD